MKDEIRQKPISLRAHVQDRLPAFLATLVGGAVAMGVNAPLTSPDDLIGNASGVAMVSLIGAFIAGTVWAKVVRRHPTQISCLQYRLDRHAGVGGCRRGGNRKRRRYIEHDPLRCSTWSGCDHICERFDSDHRTMETSDRIDLDRIVFAVGVIGSRLLVDLKRIWVYRSAKLVIAATSGMILHASKLLNT